VFGIISLINSIKLSDMNYIKKLQSENAELQSQLKRAEEMAVELLIYASSEKFWGDWENRRETFIEDQKINKTDVINRTQLIPCMSYPRPTSVASREQGLAGPDSYSWLRAKTRKLSSRELPRIPRPSKARKFGGRKSHLRRRWVPIFPSLRGGKCRDHATAQTRPESPSRRIPPTGTADLRQPVLGF